MALVYARHCGVFKLRRSATGAAVFRGSNTLPILPILPILKSEISNLKSETSGALTAYTRFYLPRSQVNRQISIKVRKNSQVFEQVPELKNIFVPFGSSAAL